MTTLIHRLFEWASELPLSPAQRIKENDKWISLSAQTYFDSVAYVALALKNRGYKSGDVSAIFSYNCPQWIYMDLGATLAGGLSAGIYPNAAEKDIHYIIEHCNATVLSVQNETYFKRVTKGEKGEKLIDSLSLIVVFEGDCSFSKKAVSFQSLLNEGKALCSREVVASLLKSLNPTSGAFLIYTSGTTGFPKAVLLSHDNLMFAADSYKSNWVRPPEGELFSFLPLSHIAEKTQNVGFGINYRYPVSFCSGPMSIFDDLVEVQPTMFIAVPRVWEKMKDGLEKKLKSLPRKKLNLVNFAMNLRRQVIKAKAFSSEISFLKKVTASVLDKAVLRKIRMGVGLGRHVRAINGAAALPVHVIEWFYGIGVEIIEGYAQSESSGILTAGNPGIPCIGTVGLPINRVELKIAHDGEILTSGRHVFLGYYKDAAATKEVFDGKWLHTGDLGFLDENKMLRIRGRKKEIMKNSEGKMIAPEPLENVLKAADPVSQAVVVGDGRAHLCALFTLKEAYSNTEKVREEIDAHVYSVNQTLSKAERIKKFLILKEEFSIANGELTPTLKIKRQKITERYASEIEKLYEGTR